MQVSTILFGDEGTEKSPITELLSVETKQLFVLDATTPTSVTSRSGVQLSCPETANRNVIGNTSVEHACAQVSCSSAVNVYVLECYNWDVYRNYDGSLVSAC
jgi:hypothetical protein